MPSPLIYLTEGSRIFLNSWKHRLLPKKYAGNAKEICEQIVEECWNGRYFRTSTGNFPQFWTRDFGFCTQSLMKLKYEEKVHHTLRYALNNFKIQGKITTTITPSGKPYDFPTPAVDSLPWLIHSIKVSKFDYYAFKGFLNKEIQKFYVRFINPQTGLVKPELKVSSIKDLAIRKSSCYDNCLVGMLARDLADLKLDNPFASFDYPDLLLRHFWSGNYFYDDLSRPNYIAGDAQIFPFITGMCGDKEILSKAMQAISFAGLDQPFPLKYTAERGAVHFVEQEIFLRNYESNSIWMHLGPLYVKVLQQVDKEKAAECKVKYTELIEKHRNYLEVFSASGKPFGTPFYRCDRGMLWAANYVTL
ncbi:TPA: hypothetical protein HA242_06640 [Candidatus Woesearchaeota archaeon]|nr:hypothetical protein [Candidatus Woesearchaeota archaeon]HIG92595.1 hypothetical protein [Candidatus Woesearchaeota archaeon]HIH13371.1 hypothetical protein [Candidatus Woesearchaeota archaeon]